MAYIVRDCVRCGTRKVQMPMVGNCGRGNAVWEIAVACSHCMQISVFVYRSGTEPSNLHNLDGPRSHVEAEPVRIATTTVDVSSHIPARIADLFREANECRQMGWYDAAGAMFRKTLDVATKHIYATDPRLAGKNPAQALRVRVQGLGALKIIEEDIVELADIAALDGNDAVHDEDPYTREEAEALEDLTIDLLDRLFVRPAKMAEVRAKQIAAGVRKP